MDGEKKLISLIVPCFNEQEVVRMFYDEVCRVARELEPRAELEIIFTDDGSEDATLEKIKELSAADKRVRYISFSRNFGKEAAMYAGLKAARGDYATVIDAYLQHPPELLIDMFAAVEDEGYDCAAARRADRKGEAPVRSFLSRSFYVLVKKLSKIDIENSCDYRLMSRRMVDAVLSLAEYNRFSKGIFSYVGFKTKWLSYENRTRAAGQTKWSFWKLFMYSVEGIVSFSTAPLAFAAFIGLFLCAAACVFACVIVIKTLIWGDPVAGFPTLSCLILFIGGIQLLVSGIMGEYLAKTYLEAKKRPLYVVRETEEDNKK